MAGAGTTDSGASVQAAVSGSWGEDMVEIIAGFRDTVMTALLAWGGVSADAPADGLRPPPVMTQEQIAPVETARPVAPAAPVLSQSR